MLRVEHSGSVDHVKEQPGSQAHGVLLITWVASARRQLPRPGKGGSVPLGVMNGSREDDDGVRGQIVRQVDEVHIFLNHGNEEIVL